MKDKVLLSAIADFFFAFLVTYFLLLLCACNTSEGKNKTVDVSTTRATIYSIATNEDLTYSYQIKDKNGKVLLSDEHAQKAGTRRNPESRKER